MYLKSSASKGEKTTEKEPRLLGDCVISYLLSLGWEGVLFQSQIKDNLPLSEKTPAANRVERRTERGRAGRLTWDAS